MTAWIANYARTIRPIRALRMLGLVALLCAPLALPAHGAPAQVAERYQNPVHAEDFADPFVLRSGGIWFAYSTHRGIANIQIFSSVDLVHWQTVGTALPFLPSWANGPRVWAPTVLARPGHHVLYYAVQERASGHFCVSAATSTSGPQGPFFDESTRPLVCQHERGGTIDPSVFTERDGRAFLLFKSEGIVHREPTRLWAAPLDGAGLRLTRAPTELLHTEQAWEEPIIENPAMAYGDGRYFLFYAANRWETAAYATGFAVCSSPLGPCHRPTQAPVLASANGAAGPGGADFFTDAAGELWISYHAWTAPRVGYPAGGSRSLRIDRVTFALGRPWIDGPSTDLREFAHHPGPPARLAKAQPTSAPPVASPGAATAATADVAPAASPVQAATPAPAATTAAPAAIPTGPETDRASAGVDGPAPSRSGARGPAAALAGVLAASVGIVSARQLVEATSSGRKRTRTSDLARVKRAL